MGRERVPMHPGVTIEVGLLIRSVGDPSAEARIAEHLGFDFVASGEHVSFVHPTANSLLCLAAAASATRTLGLMTAITLAPVYPPPLLAKMAAYLDSISRGRLELALGIGGEFPNELIACGVAPRDRGTRTTELIQVLELLWRTDGPASFDGRFTSFQDITIEPKPVRGSIPIWVSGRSDAAIKRAIAHSCGWLPYMYSPRKLAASLERFAELGDHRPPAGVLVWASVHEDPRRARTMALRSLKGNFGQDFEDILQSVCVVGNPEQVTQRLLEYADAGASRFVLAPCVENDDELDAMRELLAGSVVPAVRK